MGERTNEEVMRAYLQALTVNDVVALDGLRDTDWTLDYPQSGERIRGHANERAIADHYPGGLPDIDPAGSSAARTSGSSRRASPSSGSLVAATRGGARA